MRFLMVLVVLLLSCDFGHPVSRSGVSIANSQVVVQSNGLTLEQDNVKKRLELENKPGSIMHLYVLSAYSGQVILYSTVKGKVTSSGKKLSPSTLVYAEGKSYENLGDDGTYGSSIEYLYWWDVNNVYYQQYITGGIVVNISDKPQQFGKVTIQLEAGKK